MILNDQLRSKLAAPSTLGKSVLIAWESVLSQRLAAVRGDGVLLALDEQGATSQRPLAHGRHSRKVFIYFSLFQSFVTALYCYFDRKYFSLIDAHSFSTFLSSIELVCQHCPWRSWRRCCFRIRVLHTSSNAPRVRRRTQPQPRWHHHLPASARAGELRDARTTERGKLNVFISSTVWLITLLM